MNFRDWDWDKLDEIAASFARPYQQYVCSSAIAVSLLWAMYNRADAMVIGALAIPCA